MKTTISPQELSDALRHNPDNWFLIDVRSPGEYRSGHIPGASNYPIDRFTETEVKQLHHAANGRRVCLICQSGVRSKRAFAIWKSTGLDNVVELEGGMNRWPGEAGVSAASSGGMNLDRQVKIIAGLNVIVGSLLGAFISPWFLLIPGVFGVGLTVAGVSGSCGLAIALTRMPWNR
ncbi:rhodanese-like domain-containing protein [Cerasicoccus frondis]|uniref:rhodanese-like domain-containing protein n=1 Tax=Cerasicoccus frondis TaxID=490090 RepID=UPI00285250B8|nr:rhodanese-like domain-containing protein [Cerasicoccus frondis]